MSDSDNVLEKKLLEAWKKLVDPLNSSVQNLLHLLDKLFLCLSEVEQGPHRSIQNALSPLMKELVVERLFKHSNVDVKVAVAACIGQILRIASPDVPYGDKMMKEAFQLVVASFEDLADIYSLSHAKRISILENVSHLKLCNVLLDLECEELFIEMFQHFLRAIRDHHPMKVFLCMENIVTHALQENNDIQLKMLSPVLQYVKKDDEIPLVSRRLAEQVLMNSSSSNTKSHVEEDASSCTLSVEASKDKSEESVTSEQSDARSVFKLERWMWEIKEKDRAARERLSRRRILISLIAKTELSENELNLKNKLIKEMLEMLG